MLTDCRPCVSSGQCCLDDADASAHTGDGTVCPLPLTAASQMIRQTALGGGPDQPLHKQYSHTYSCTSMALQQQAPCNLNISLIEVGLQLTYARLSCPWDATVVNVAVTGRPGQGSNNCLTASTSLETRLACRSHMPACCLQLTQPHIDAGRRGYLPTAYLDSSVRCRSGSSLSAQRRRMTTTTRSSTLYPQQQSAKQQMNGATSQSS